MQLQTPPPPPPSQPAQPHRQLMPQAVLLLSDPKQLFGQTLSHDLPLKWQCCREQQCC